MNKKLFNDWARSYNESVLKSEKNKTYPFFGYSDVQKTVFELSNRVPQSRILEMGIGTGMMTKKLYELNHQITGVDFSSKMIEEAKRIMPFNTYVVSDFISALDIIRDTRYNTIIFSYSIHHMKPIHQKYLLSYLSNNLAEEGKIIIGDVMTNSNQEMDKLADQYEKIWDPEEFYPTWEDYQNEVLDQHYIMDFQKITHCSGIITLTKKKR